MQLANLLTEERAASPVIAVILMVAITVILAATIGTFVLGLGDATNSAPQASLEFNFTSADGDDSFDGDAGDYVNISHRAGESIQANTLTVQGDTGGLTRDSAFPTKITVSDEGRWGEVNANELVRVIWSGETSDTQQVIARDNAPT